MKLLIIYLILMNATGLVLMLADKIKARKNLWRIPEKVLLGVALVGGSAGALVGMYAARHKTRHPVFTIGIPVILFLQVAVYGIFFK